SKVAARQLARLRPSFLAFLREFDPRVEDDPFDHRLSVDADTALRRDTHRIQANLRQSLGGLARLRDLELPAILGASTFDTRYRSEFDYSPADILDVPDGRLSHEQRSAEVRIAGALDASPLPGVFDFQLGGFFYHASFVSVGPLAAGRDFDRWLTSAAG